MSVISKLSKTSKISKMSRISKASGMGKISKTAEVSMSKSRGSQPFGTCLHPNQNCTPLRTPKSDLFTFCVPPTKKLNPNKLHLSFFILLTPVGSSGTPG
jgi:hypothetical protein